MRTASAESDAGVEHSVVNDRIVGVAGNKETFISVAGTRAARRAFGH